MQRSLSTHDPTRRLACGVRSVVWCGACVAPPSAVRVVCKLYTLRTHVKKECDFFHTCVSGRGRKKGCSFILSRRSSILNSGTVLVLLLLRVSHVSAFDVFDKAQLSLSVTLEAGASIDASVQWYVKDLKVS